VHPSFERPNHTKVIIRLPEGGHADAGDISDLSRGIFCMLHESNHANQILQRVFYNNCFDLLSNDHNSATNKLLHLRDLLPLQKERTVVSS
jgi:hypothetical protein